MANDYLSKIKSPDSPFVPAYTDSIATLRLLDNDNEDVADEYQVRYHTASGDGGGGTFVWDAAETSYRTRRSWTVGSSYCSGSVNPFFFGVAYV